MPRIKQQPKKIDTAPLVEEASKSKTALKKQVEALSGSSRRERQVASSVIYVIAKKDISKVEPFTKDIVDALNRPEGQTRWEALMTLTLLVPTQGKECAKAIDAAEDALFDESTGSLRLAAFTFLCEIGKTTAARSKNVWSLIDEAIQCYHGDVEFDDMLNALVGFSEGKLDATVKEELAERMAFDAEFGSGNLQAKSKLIINNVSAKKKASKK